MRLYLNPDLRKTQVVNNEAEFAARHRKQTSNVTSGRPLGIGFNTAGWITFWKGYRVHNLLKHLNIHVVAISLTVMHVKFSWAVRGFLILFAATGQALIINFHNSPRNPRIHIQILQKKPQRINLIDFLIFQPNIMNLTLIWHSTQNSLSLVNTKFDRLVLNCIGIS